MLRAPQPIWEREAAEELMRRRADEAQEVSLNTHPHPSPLHLSIASEVVSLSFSLFRG
jgi:hypothetical protein